MACGGVSRAAKGADCKSAGLAFVGSSPTSPTILKSKNILFIVCPVTTRKHVAQEKQRICNVTESAARPCDIDATCTRVPVAVMPIRSPVGHGAGGPPQSTMLSLALRERMRSPVTTVPPDQLNFPMFGLRNVGCRCARLALSSFASQDVGPPYSRTDRHLSLSCTNGNLSDDSRHFDGPGLFRGQSVERSAEEFTSCSRDSAVGTGGVGRWLISRALDRGLHDSMQVVHLRSPPDGHSHLVFREDRPDEL